MNTQNTSMEKITEMPSPYRHLEQMSTEELVKNINEEDKQVALAVRLVLPSIVSLVDALAQKLGGGGRLFYMGAGTSGRLGILDASEWAPTYGVSEEMVHGIMAGGQAAYRFGIEDAEDNFDTGWNDLLQHHISEKDFVIGIAASGSTPYVAGALKKCREQGILTGCIVCNPHSLIASHSDFPVEVITGPEFVTGSTRMKAGTATKMALNIISTTVMIRLGRVKDNRMVFMQLSNEKLVDRGTKMVMKATGLQDYEKAKALLLKYGSVHEASQNH